MLINRFSINATSIIRGSQLNAFIAELYYSRLLPPLPLSNNGIGGAVIKEIIVGLEDGVHCTKGDGGGRSGGTYGKATLKNICSCR